MHEELKKTEYIKTGGKGQPANPADPYPVDEKILQLQSHEPFCKISEISIESPFPDCITPVIKELIGLSHNVERRLVALENILSTVTRYAFRSASRMQINCVYYGGQEVISKYNSIRCMHDNRVDDGQLVTLDQCLSCTRYEPIYGRVYEILDEEGLNAQQFMDDWQMSYMSQEDYILFSCVEKMNSERPMADCLEPILGPPLLFLEGKWEEAFEMDWSFTPAEQHKSHITEEG